MGSVPNRENLIRSRPALVSREQYLVTTGIRTILQIQSTEVLRDLDDKLINGGFLLCGAAWRLASANVALFRCSRDIHSKYNAYRNPTTEF